MNKETLKTLRIIIPGVIIYLFFLPLFKGTIDIGEIVSSINSIKDLLYFIIILPLGALYYVFQIRGYFISQSLRKIHENIYNQLLSPFQNEPLIVKASSKLRQGRILLDIFYNFVDNDESLKERAKNVYLNGLIWSSVADVASVGSIAASIYLIAFIISGNWDYSIAFLVLLLVSAFSFFVLLPRVTKAHIQLSNEQLGYISLYKKEDLQKKLQSLAKEVDP
jgi:ABC-type multidrug transport system fused ATPase/permease subunit